MFVSPPIQTFFYVLYQFPFKWEITWCEGITLTKTLDRKTKQIRNITKRFSHVSDFLSGDGNTTVFFLKPKRTWTKGSWYCTLWGKRSQLKITAVVNMSPWWNMQYDLFVSCWKANNEFNYLWAYHSTIWWQKHTPPDFQWCWKKKEARGLKRSLCEERNISWI